ncbi:MAG: BTAD domain-containing putative transcriptional regulator [Capsulimonadaceae bacterium]|nr:BTAD domain-containing putative transcriptional regulator [Capsulimonadaceae bacterium]
MTPPNEWRINLLGGFDVTVDGVPISRLRSRKGRVLLALLVVRASKPVERAWLAGVLWPDSTDAQALASLRQTLADLRRAMGAAAVSIEGPSARTLMFSPGKTSVDVLDFDAAVERADPESLEQAVLLYRGPLLANSPDEAIWNERERRELAFIKSLDGVGANRASAGDLAGAIDCYRRLIAEDPYRENAVQAFMKLCAQKGDYPEAYVAYRDLRNRLQQDLRAHPAPETVAVYEQIRRSAKVRITASDVAPPQGGSSSSEQPSQSEPRVSAVEMLPFPLTSLVGRAGDVASVKGRLEASRLVTLTGIGAIGKTRIALAVGHDLAVRFRDGVRFVDLGGVDDNDVAAAIEAASTPASGSGSDVDRVQASGRLEQFLLIVDNGERVAASCAPSVVGLLRAYPKARILATGRQPLGVPGEVVFRVGPLAIPDAAWGDSTHYSQAADGPSLVHTESIRLFVERAAAVSPGFSLNAGNSASIAHICRLLDGHPLAIEMAAARTSLLTVQQIAGWVDSNLFVLTAGSGVPPRHQTLRAVVEGSYRGLSDRERLLLMRLSVFPNGWTHDAAEAVCVDEEMSREEIIDRLSALVDRSLVWVEWLQAGRVRYRLMPIVRRYCLEQSERSGEIPDRMLCRFASYYIELCRATQLRVGQTRLLDGVQALDPELDNVAGALDLRLDASRVDPVRADATLCLASYWAIKGRPWLAIARLDALIGELPSDRYPELLAEAHLALGQALLLAGQDEAAGASLSQAQEAYATLGDPAGQGRALASQAAVLLRRGEIVKAKALTKQGLELVGAVLKPQRIPALRVLALIKALRGRMEFALNRANEMMDIAGSCDDELLAGDAMLTMGNVNEFSGDIDTARRAYIATLALAEEWVDGPLAVAAIEGIARLLLLTNMEHKAALLLGAAQSYRQRAGLGPDLVSTFPINQAARQLMAEPAYLAERQAGGRMTLGQAMASATQ